MMVVVTVVALVVIVVVVVLVVVKVVVVVVVESVIVILFRLHCFNEQGFLIHIKCTLDHSVVVVSLLLFRCCY